MAREYGKAWFSMFTDDDFCSQPNMDKFLYMTLLGQPSMNYAGVLPINLKRWRKAIREGDRIATDIEVKAALVRLERRAYVFTDDDTGEALVRSFIRRDEIDKQPNVMLSALRSVAAVESPKLARVLLSELQRIPLPEVKGDTTHACRLRESLKRLMAAAVARLEELSKGLPEVLPEPFNEGLDEGFARPAETEPLPEGLPEGISEPPVVVEVGVVKSPSVGGSVEGARARTPTPAEATDLVDAPPPEFCPQHMPDGTSAPCGRCAVFRKRHIDWLAARSQQASEAARQRAQTERRQAASTARQEIDDCGLCDDEGYRPNHAVCDHIDRTETARNGAAMVREALTKAKPQ